MMRRRTAVLLASLLPMIGSSIWIAAMLQPVDSRVYTVAQVQAGLQHAPAVWIGRTVLVRAEVAGFVLDRSAANGRAGQVSTTSVLIAIPWHHCPNASIGCGVPFVWWPPMGITAVQLSDADLTGTATPAPTLLATIQWSSTWLDMLRQVPWVSSLLAPPQLIDVFKKATYRLHLLPRESGCHRLCAEAILVVG